MQLTIRICGHTMTFAAPGDAGTIVYEPYHVKSGVSMSANLRQAFNESSLLAGGHRGVVVTTDARVVLVPDEKVSADAAAGLCAYTFGDDSSREVLSTPLRQESAVAVYGVNRDLMTVLGDNFESVTIVPLMQAVWKHFHRRSFSAQHRRMFAYLNGKTLELSLFRHHRFDFCNRFVTPDAPDALYPLLNAWRQTGLKHDTDELIVAGDSALCQPLLDMAREYLRNVTPVDAAEEFGEAHAALTAGMPFDLQALLK